MSGMLIRSNMLIAQFANLCSVAWVSTYPGKPSTKTLVAPVSRVQRVITEHSNSRRSCFMGLGGAVVFDLQSYTVLFFYDTSIIASSKDIFFSKAVFVVSVSEHAIDISAEAHGVP